MSVSTETETSENAQQNEEQEAAQAEEQEVVEQVAEPPVPNTANDDQENKFDIEKSKAKLEYISILSAVVGLFSTILFKFLSFGRHFCFSFDINYCEFNLTNHDLMIFIMSICYCALTVAFCYFVNKYKKLYEEIEELKAKINEFKNSKYNRIKKFLLFFVVPIFIYFIFLRFCYFNYDSKVDIFPKSTYTTILKISFGIFVFLLSVMFFDGLTLDVMKVFLILCLFITCTNFIRMEYKKAENQKEFEIIASENDEGKLQEYVVISKGSSYSAYQCSTEEQDAGKILIIHTDRHRFFPLDDTDTRLNVFDEYHLYKYGMPLDTDEESDSDAYQSSEE